MKVVMTLISVVLTLMTSPVVVAQTTIFTYQGDLTDSGTPQATYQMRFRLFDALASGSQVGGTIENGAVAVSDGIFTVALDFGAPVFSGADRFLEIAVRRNGGESYTVLNPRQQIASSPYSIRTLSAQTADMALDAQKLGGVAASEYVKTTDVGGSFINNGATLQDASFNIDGDGFVGGTLGIGTAAPGSGIELRGTGLNAQQRITDAASGNSLVLQGGPGSGMKVTGYNYGTGVAQPLYLSIDGANTLINTGGGNVGIRTASPTHSLDVNGTIRAFSTSDSRISVETSGTNNMARLLLNSANRSWFLGTTQSFNNDEFYIGEGISGNKMTIANDGTVGIGKRPDPFFRLDAAGPIRALSASAGHVVAETTGGTNSWARFYMRSPSQSWFIGTSQNFSGNQLYIIDETSNQTRFTIQPAGGPIFLQGNVTSSGGGYGLPKAMVRVLANGTISRCYNGITGETTSGCGFISVRTVVGGIGPKYVVDFGFDVSTRFGSLTVDGANDFFGRLALGGNSADVRFSDGNPLFTQDSNFFLIVY